MGTFNSATTIKIREGVSDNINLSFISSTYTYTVPANCHFKGHLYLDSWTSAISINVAGVTNWPSNPNGDGRAELNLGPGETITLNIQVGTRVGHLIGTVFENAGAV